MDILAGTLDVVHVWTEASKPTSDKSHSAALPALGCVIPNCGAISARELPEVEKAQRTATVSSRASTKTCDSKRTAFSAARRPRSSDCVGPVLGIAAPNYGRLGHLATPLDLDFDRKFVFTMTGITVGFHRLFTHNSFKTTPLIRRLLAVAG